MRAPAPRTAAVVALALVTVAHGAFLGWWIVDDAAISFAYARNWADGHGLVPYVGGERVEGYSNFSWMALLALGEALGVDARWGAKLLSFAFSAATVPVVARLGARALPERPTEGGLVAAALFATFAQTGIFASAGLENPLFGFLLALGLLWGDEESAGVGASPARFPRSAVAYLLLALTRPEGIVYAAAGGAFALLAAVRARAGARWIATWLLVFFGPFVAYQAVRWWYFAWPFPMTYYAKVLVGPIVLLDWDGPGWTYLRDFWDVTGMGWFAPLALIGAVGLDTRARSERAAALVALGGGLVLLPDDLWGAPGWALHLRTGGIWAIAGLALLLGLRARPTVRGPSASALFIASLFAVRALGDWMDGFRWMSLAGVPLCVLLASGLVDLVYALWNDRRMAGAALGATTLAFAAVNLQNTLKFRDNPEISPEVVLARAYQIEALAAQLGIDERLRVYTYDMGGCLWKTDAEMFDGMGLVDVTMAQHKRHARDAYVSYLLVERRPHFIGLPHPLVSALHRTPGFDDQYLEIGEDLFARRDLVFEPAWSGPAGPETAFGPAVSVTGLTVVAPVVAVGGQLRVEVGVRAGAVPDLSGRLWLRDAAGASVAAWPLTLGYGWADSGDWASDEVFHGRYPLDLPPVLPTGTYTVGVGLVSGDRTLATPDGAQVAWLGTVALATDGVAQDAAMAARVRALEQASAGACDDAVASWRRARAHVATDPAWGPARAADVQRAIAECWLAAAPGDPVGALPALRAARSADPDAPGVAERLYAVAEARYEAGLEARAAGRHAEALGAFTDALALEPGRSWARRYAEEARAAVIRGPEPTPPE